MVVNSLDYNKLHKLDFEYSDFDEMDLFDHFQNLELEIRIKNSDNILKLEIDIERIGEMEYDVDRLNPPEFNGHAHVELISAYYSTEEKDQEIFHESKLFSKINDLVLNIYDV